jgi:hypothetical protein
VDDGKALVIQIDEGVADDMWERTAILFAWSASMIASYGDAGGWLETAATSGVVDMLVPLRV